MIAGKVHYRATQVCLEVVNVAEVCEAPRYPNERILDDVVGRLGISGEEVSEPNSPCGMGPI